MRNLCLFGFALAAGLAACAAAGVPQLADFLAGAAQPGHPVGGEGYADALRVVQARKAAKLRAVRALLAGDCELLEAAARFRELDAAEPRAKPWVHPHVFAGDTEAERYCRVVLEWAGEPSWPDPPSGPALEVAVRRLREELEKHRLCGTLELPPPTDLGRPAPATLP